MEKGSPELVNKPSSPQNTLDSPFLKILMTSVLLFLLFGVTFFVAYQTTKKGGSPASGVPTTVPTQTTTAKDGCIIGGCNGEICTEAGGNTASICIFRPEYQCYKTAVCEKQADGKCGWTPTSELKTCLAQYQ